MYKNKGFEILSNKHIYRAAQIALIGLVVLGFIKDAHLGMLFLIPNSCMVIMAERLMTRQRALNDLQQELKMVKQRKEAIDREMMD